MEYMISNESDGDGNVFLILVEVGFYHPRAFECLGAIKKAFMNQFTRAEYGQARSAGLDKEFNSYFDQIYVGLSLTPGNLLQAKFRQNAADHQSRRENQ